MISKSCSAICIGRRTCLRSLISRSCAGRRSSAATASKIGTIETIERDEETDRVEFLQIGRGGFLGFGAERFLVPVTAIVKVDEKHVYIDRPLQQLDGVPEYDYERINDPDYCAGVRAWWCEPIVVPESRRQPIRAKLPEASGSSPCAFARETGDSPDSKPQHGY